jgi:UDP-N-acetylglucosamine/UDP-N-acetylgalactosamine 4-epimerase
MSVASKSGGSDVVAMKLPAEVAASLSQHSHHWLVTGGAGFIGSHLVQRLLEFGQRVTSMDNFATGHRSNLDDVRSQVGAEHWKRHRLLETDIRDADACRAACRDVDFVLHHAALGSVPRSIELPLDCNAANVTGFINMLVAAKDAGVKRFVYASSSSVYGDYPGLPKVEAEIGEPLSPYAVSKRVNELYANVFSRCYGIQTIGLRYFNVFGARQDPNGAYAAVIPRWVHAMLNGDPVDINGDGETTRDFCYVLNVVQANILSAMTTNEAAANEAYNVAVGGRTSLNALFITLRDLLAVHAPELAGKSPRYRDFRAGDVRHSQADISKARRLLGFEPTHDLKAGLQEALPWYVQQARAGQVA